MITETLKQQANAEYNNFHTMPSWNAILNKQQTDPENDFNCINEINTVLFS